MTVIYDHSSFSYDMTEEQEEELASIQAIYPEIVLTTSSIPSATLEIAVQPSEALPIRFTQLEDDKRDMDITSVIEQRISFKHLPPLRLHIELPQGYPELSPPRVSLSTVYGWLPQSALLELQNAASSLWEAYGRCQTLYLYIDYLQQCVERGFDLANDAAFVLSSELKDILCKFDKDMTQSIFNIGTYDCGVCLEPKKGQSCHKMDKCGHIFCKQCLHDFYNNAITEGDVVTIRCLDPGCSKASKRSLHPRELLEMGVEEANVRRYVEMKRKKKLESDKTTVYCPRTWCQHPARSKRYPRIPTNLLDYPDLSDCEDDEAIPDKSNTGIPARPEQDERLAICEKCEFAFCRTCCASWHGSFVRCYPRDSSELTAEEKASYEYIQQNTSPCPTCSSPTQKTMGCNHMQCFQCRTHFCYLCGAWLDADMPYKHFNTQGTGCYQRLWELEEGDEGQAPADGRGFAGARAWEAMAIEAARQADEAEAAAAAEPAEPAEAVAHVEDPAEVQEVIELIINLENARIEPIAPVQPRRRRRRNAFPPGPNAQGAANAVRAHERGVPRAERQRRQRPALPPIDNDQRLEDEMRRFIELAQRDEEDDWDSDEFADDDAAWHIH